MEIIAPSAHAEKKCPGSPSSFHWLFIHLEMPICNEDMLFKSMIEFIEFSGSFD
jgi:hypothetical protein